MLKRKRSVSGKRTAGSLRLHQFTQPLGVERTDVGVVGRGAHVGLRVAGPSHSLVTLRAIGWQVQKVRPLSPDDVLEQLIDHRVAALERAGHRRIAVHHQAGDRVSRGLAGKVLNFDELESVEGEPWLENFAVWIALADVEIRCPCLAQILGHQSAVGMQHFAVSDRDFVPGGTFDLQANRAGKVLAEIEGDKFPPLAWSLSWRESLR